MAQLEKELGEVVQKYTELSGIIDSANSIRASLDKLESIDATEEIKACDVIHEELDAIASDLADLTGWLDQYAQKDKSVNALQKEIEEVEKELADVPLCSKCGRPMEDCDDSMR
jgi:uncharacterized coiled-coil DUF342 family protein